VRATAILALALAGCHAASTCDSLGPATGVGASAARLRLEVYAATAANCSGDEVTSSSLPLQVVEYRPDMPPAIPLKPGDVIVHLLAYADERENLLIGEGCRLTTIRAGDTACLALPLDPRDASTASPPGDGGACTPIAHQTGLPNVTYSDCVGTDVAVDGRRAGEACSAAGLGSCSTIGCSGGSGQAVCGRSAGCTCWAFSGPTQGHVHVNSSGGNCSCGSISDPTWN
jgi:hypothetical protein